jgi:hypothetical protein
MDSHDWLLYLKVLDPNSDTFTYELFPLYQLDLRVAQQQQPDQIGIKGFQPPQIVE